MKSGLKLASVDIGTNSTRLLVAECDGQTTRTVDRRMVITRLGEGVDRGRTLLPGAMERTCEVLEDYREVCRASGVESARAAATSAVRDCDNAGEFFRLAGEALGVTPELLSGEEEALLSFNGAVSDLGGHVEEGDPVFVFDIGGGSTELIFGAAAGAGVNARSVDVGCVRMSERFLAADPPSPVALGRMESFLVATLRPQVEMLMSGAPSLGVGLAGTVTTVSGIKLGLREYDTERIHHCVLTRAEVEEVFRKLASVPVEERKRVMGLEPGRADIIVGGTAVLRAVMDTCGLDSILVSEKDILDGLVLDAYRRLS